MYEVDDQDVVVLLSDIPAASPGAPEPVVLADEGTAVVAYYAPDSPDGATEPAGLGDEEVVVLCFHEVHSLMFGVPNDEALSGHPLADRGLTPYGSFRIEGSSWIRRLERMNAVHARHSAAAYSSLFHFIVTFHDSTFECVCGSAPIATVVNGSTPQEAAVAAPRAEGPWPTPRTLAELRNQPESE